jgi:O-succinylbenzoic acid--CoA ligase
LSSNSFEWIGRIDWVVNSGGIKFSLEKAEESIADFFQQRSINNAFTSYKIPDKTYGEKWILIIAGKDNTIDTSELKSYCKKRLGKYIYPKEILFSNRLAYLPSGKIDRLNSYKEALKL